jgi:hypothetical protein
VPLNVIACIPYFMKTYQVVQKLFVGDTQTGDLISLCSSLESRLKIVASKSISNGHDFSADFHKNLPVGSNVTGEGHTDGQTDSMVIL